MSLRLGRPLMVLAAAPEMTELGFVALVMIMSLRLGLAP
jgi:hypothetical protein